MDQIKKILAVMKTHHYWIITGLVFVLATVGYVVSRLSLSSLINDRMKAVTAKYSSLSSVKNSAPTHPNSHSHLEMDKLIGVMSADVKTAWEAQYKRQEKLFFWPEKAFVPG